jgi:hypothetical protein
MVLIYTNQITARLAYIVDYIFNQQFGIVYKITNNKTEFESENELVKINYSDEHFNNQNFQIIPHQLLFELHISKQNVDTIIIDQQTYLFPTKGALPFDIFAACFYCITRYEEYLPHTQNRYGQFQAKESWAYQQQVLNKPIVDIWVCIFKKQLVEKFPKLIFKEQKFTSQFTYDIDTAYYFAGKPIFKNIALLCKDLFYLNIKQFKKRLAAIYNKENDIANTYSHILLESGKTNPIFFFLVGDHNHKKNSNLPYIHMLMQELLNSIKKQVDIGIHPSYETPRNKQLIAKEKQSLETLIDTPITKSRQHYLRFYMPTTFNHLISCGITDEYSMCFADLPGFRAGTCKPFLFFDVVTNEAKPLTIHPTTFMEGTFAEDLQMNPNDALIQMKQLIEEVKKVNGNFICIWHNHSLSNFGFWEGWKNVHDVLIKDIIKYA